MNYTVTVCPGELPPGLNSRLHWAARYKATRTARSSAYGFAYVARIMQRIPKATGMRDVLVEVLWPLYHKGPLPDIDNAVGRCKPLLDGIVDAGLLLSDSDRGIHRITWVQERDPDVLEVTVRFTLTDSPEPGLTTND